MTLILSLSLHLTSSEQQHIEISKATLKIDQTDEPKLSSWIQNFSPFTVSESLNGSLKALPSGIIADESTSADCSKAESIGQEIQENFNGIELEQAKVNQKHGTTTIDTITHGIIVNDKHITIKPKVLFTPLTGM